MKLTVTCEDDLLNAVEQIIASKMAFENRITAGCCTISEIAKAHHMTAADMNSFLCDVHILQKKGRRYLLAPKYRNGGYAVEYRKPHISYHGQLKYKVKLLWTEKGREMIEQLIKL
ncbi:phage antirepressor KilAC domain-containing protein [Prevotella sp. P6B4]|uniref:phage antirepressor KilAC domain-containing protein n=1 Tax=Prevotella sp. P6B4 TaxID=1410614 RepID=UPI000A5C11C3|nr:phage antirepressor KilAC domain-containing protein [Prevotella sp. P6B4]